MTLTEGLLRQYHATHPWLTFTFDMQKISEQTWLQLGEAKSKCEHLAGVPLLPDAAKELYRVSLVKGAQATVAIEGNTMTVEEVFSQLEGRLTLPESREYQAQEVQNVIDAICDIDYAGGGLQPLPFTPERIKELNALVLRNVPVRDGVRPGRFTTEPVAVGNYRGAPGEDLEYLIERYCEWINLMIEQSRTLPTEMRFAVNVVIAVLAHVYFVWIHPFGDGNGRTARLLECQLLSQSGMIPLPATNLLSDHYNQTRPRYYVELDTASRSGGDLVPFIRYAVQGYVDGLRQQIHHVRAQHLDITWRNYVHAQFDNQVSLTAKRQRQLVLDLGDRQFPRDDLPLVSGRVAKQYRGKSEKTLSRDLNKLVQMGLLRKIDGIYSANISLVRAWLPPMYVA